MTTLLLYRNGFYVGKYISLEAKIAKNEDLYYDALGQSQQSRHEGEDIDYMYVYNWSNGDFFELVQE